MSIIEARNISKIYGENAISFQALKNISLSIDKGEFVSLVGRSGSGKSTLLHILALLDTPTDGQVIIEGAEANKLSSKEKCLLRNKKIGFVFQSFYLEENYTVYKNIEMPLLIAGTAKSERKKLVYTAAEKLGITSKLKNKSCNLSGGEKQRVAIARAIVNSPDIIFADEPCGNLDVENSEKVLDILSGLSKEGVTVILVTHNNNDALRTNRIISLCDGMVVDKKGA